MLFCHLCVFVSITPVEQKNFAISTKTTFKGVFRVVTLQHHETLKLIPLPPLVPQAPHTARIHRHRPPRAPSPPHRPRQHRPHRINRRTRRHQPPAPTLRPVPQQPLHPLLHHPARHNSQLHTPNSTLRAARAPARTNCRAAPRCSRHLRAAHPIHPCAAQATRTRHPCRS